MRKHLQTESRICFSKNGICTVVSIISKREAWCPVPCFGIEHNLSVAIIGIHAERSACNHIIRTISPNALVGPEIQEIVL